MNKAPKIATIGTSLSTELSQDRRDVSNEENNI